MAGTQYTATTTKMSVACQNNMIVTKTQIVHIIKIKLMNVHHTMLLF